MWRVASLGRVPAACVDEVFAATTAAENLMESSTLSRRASPLPSADIQAQSVFDSARVRMIDAENLQRAVIPHRSSRLFNQYFYYRYNGYENCSQR